MMSLNNIINIDAKEELARRYHQHFMDYCWIKKNPFKLGKHTKAVCDEIDNCIEKYKQDISSYNIIIIPVRHGKTDLISRYLPPHLLGEFPDAEVTIATYGQNLSNKFSRFARSLVKTNAYKRLYPDIRLSKESASVENWEIDDTQGTTQWVGIGGALTGKGSQFAILDDYLKDSQDAESDKIRDKCWDWFTNVFMTRLAPIHCVFILATRWHKDDLIGRIIESNDSKNKRYDPDFPKFNIIKFKARENDGSYLFPERYNKKWYKSQFATLGTYGASSLLQGEPTIKGGNRLKVDNINIIEPANIPRGLVWVRGWDLASSDKERNKNEPDYTVGCLAAMRLVRKEGLNKPMEQIFIKHIVRIQAEAPKRNKRIIKTAELDGKHVRIGIEVVAGYKDTYTIMKDILMGIRPVEEITVSKDKSSRATPLEPIFEAGNVFIVRGDWNHDFISELESFPSGSHDDQVDALICCYKMLESFDFEIEDDYIGERNTYKMYDNEPEDEEDDDLFEDADSLF